MSCRPREALQGLFQNRQKPDEGLVARGDGGESVGWDMQGLSGQWREAWFDRSIRHGCRGDSDGRRGQTVLEVPEWQRSSSVIWREI